MNGDKNLAVMHLKCQTIIVTGSLATAAALLCTDDRNEDSPQVPPSATVDLTSTVTAGNVPMVTVKMKHTDRAMIQI